MGPGARLRLSLSGYYECLGRGGFGPVEASGLSMPDSRFFSLSQLRPGQVGVVRSAGVGEQDAALLGAMGLCCNAKVRLCRAGEPCIVAISSGRGAGCRIGLSRPLADKIVVDLVADAKADGKR
jgi:Fe2+ transport system protein FeoA